MVFDAHDRAFTLFKGTCRRGNKSGHTMTVDLTRDWVRNRVSAREGRAFRAAGTIPVADRTELSNVSRFVLATHSA
jgi:hypothetical protein